MLTLHKIEDLEKELEWLEYLIYHRLSQDFDNVGQQQEVRPPVHRGDGQYAKMVRSKDLSIEERLILIMALVPYIRPSMLDIFFMQNETVNRGFTQFGGKLAKTHGGFIPTLETVAYVWAGDDMDKRIELLNCFREDGFISQKRIFTDIPYHMDTSIGTFYSMPLEPSNDFVQMILLGQYIAPDTNPGFPAQKVHTSFDWDDIVLHEDSRKRLDIIRNWIKYKKTILDGWQLDKKIKKGYAALFHGPPGTGKTLTAGAIGQEAGMEVYRIDLSLISSKWVGETEKNLSKIFDIAHNKGWILFFDEADAIFGKRGDVKQAQDKYANQENSYLLQRTEEYEGIVILSSNLKGNIDEAFYRRFQNVIHFPLPDEQQRVQLWQYYLDGVMAPETEERIKQIARSYTISGGEIVNVIKNASILALSNHQAKIEPDTLEEAIRMELNKMGKSI